MLGAAVGAVVLTAPAAHDPVENPVWLVILPLGVLTLLTLRGMYAPRIGPRFLDDAAHIVAATAFTVMAITFARVLFTGEEFPDRRAFANGSSWPPSLRRTRRRDPGGDEGPAKGGGGRPTLIIGAGRVGHLLAKRLLASPEIGLHPVGFLDPAERATSEHLGVPILGDISTIEQAVLEHRVEHAIIGFSRSSPEVELESLQRLQELGVSVSIVPRLFEGLPDRFTVDRVGALPLVSIHPRVSRSWQVAAKYVSDRAIAGVAILVLSPLLILAAVGVLVSVGRPLLFRQRRVGLDRRELTCSSSGPCVVNPTMRVRSRRDGKRSPRALLRVAWRAQIAAPVSAGSCVERHSMSCRSCLTCCGARCRSWVPARSGPSTYERLSRKYALYLRHRVKAGMTGWAQVHGLRGRTPVADRVEYDNYYIENWSLWLDVKILLLTVLAVFRDRNE